ncbi:hypothetical protein B0H10DRAFT_1943134 [Mycena sp. CBHHK59/15]|nr:hypothetical protein B0H10DRAFT_1943134 [Mycena sp. CBHHK59/15]
MGENPADDIPDRGATTIACRACERPGVRHALTIRVAGAKHNASRDTGRSAELEDTAVCPVGTARRMQRKTFKLRDGVAAVLKSATAPPFLFPVLVQVSGIFQRRILSHCGGDRQLKLQVIPSLSCPNMSVFTAAYPVGHPDPNLDIPGELLVVPDHRPFSAMWFPPLEVTISNHDSAAQERSSHAVEISDSLMKERFSCRYYLPKPVEKKLIEEIVDAARFSPSGNNMQNSSPNDYYIGDLKDKISREMLQAHQECPDAYSAQYHYYPAGPIPAEYARRRYFLQSITIAARARGLETISQESPAKYQLILRKHLPIGDDEIVACGLSMGYPDLEMVAKFSAKQPKREVSDIVEFFVTPTCTRLLLVTLFLSFAPLLGTERMPAFASNGLLGPTSALQSSFLDTVEPTPKAVTSFTLNGLLGPTLAGSSSGSAMQFRSNGLLGGTNDETGGPALAGSSPDDDDDLPPVSKAFGIPTRLVAPTDTTTSTSRTSVRATTFDGKTMYLKRRPKVSRANRNKVPLGGFTQRMGNLLDVPIHRLLDVLSVEVAAKLQEADRQPMASTSDVEEVIEETLWVDRYRPRQFTDLMGNERVARETMAWVKQWDWCVFGKTRGKKRPREDDEAFDAADEYHRPREKLLLLSGPPGLGKTTLAHVVARQAGYEVMEINASDARSGLVIDDRIRPALESGRAVGSSKPVLLVIDEIDGATGAGENNNSFIHKLVQLTYDKPWKKSRSGKGRDPNAKRPILRPIICICNDQNAASLAKLRPHALQIRFTRPADIHTVKRLREVCEIEGLKADSRALTTLVGVARGDLRGCLNTLQFIKSKNQEVTEAVIRGATVGMKEAETSLVSVLNSLFTPLTRKRVKELALTEAEEARYVGRLSREVDGCGRESSIAVGCFAHYATLHQHDANFSRYEKANEWLVTFDLLSAAMYSDGDFALSQYLPYTLVPFYPLFKERGGQRVERSQEDWEAIRTRANDEIYKSFSRCLQAASTRNGGDYRHLVSTPVLQLEFAPYINRIISPPLRPVNSQVIRPEERALLTRLVEIMSTLELQFFQERAEDGQLTYRLDPPIDVFVTYDGKRAADISVSRYAVRHLVAGEIEAQLISRKVDIVEKAKRGKHDFFGKSAGPKHSEDMDHPPSSPGQPLNRDAPLNKRARTEAVVDIADKPPVDFFGRLITVPSLKTTKAAERKNVDKKYRVTYRFKEGNSAAVRKPIKVKAFM